MKNFLTSLIAYPLGILAAIAGLILSPLGLIVGGWLLYEHFTASISIDRTAENQMCAVLFADLNASQLTACHFKYGPRNATVTVEAMGETNDGVARTWMQEFRAAPDWGYFRRETRPFHFGR